MSIERMYHIVAINEKTGKKTYLTGYPMNHDESCVMLGKQSNRVKHVRVQLEEVSVEVVEASGMTDSEKVARRDFSAWYDSLTVQERAAVCDINDVWFGWRACSRILEAKPSPQLVNPDPNAKGSQEGCWSSTIENCQKLRNT